ncbi:DUF1559 family PulG-like putative transporter [Blastopirellula retiformator]|uniref:DUF1559 domain-containing protein n=1 Tax=Blastopirellula retiformator TaxID=2527970 RepID=A0A5C5VMQ2_9BACT|nr:DUF1559 domain-containing protein [Blastopirellula retiformator]TWT39313.1 hypothetical protein Enr8_10110 [Blastopirellula retiformator]
MPRTLLLFLALIPLTFGCSGVEQAAAPDADSQQTPVDPPPAAADKNMETAPSTPAETPAKPAAQPANPAAATAPTWIKEISPFLGESTFAIVRLDWPNPDLEAILQEMEENEVDTGFFEEDVFTNPANSPEFAKGVKELAIAFYAMESDLGNGETNTRISASPLFHTTGAVSDKDIIKIIVGDRFADIPPETLEKGLIRHGEWFTMVNRPDEAERLANLKPYDATKLDAAVAAIGPAPIQAIALLDDDSRTLMIEQRFIPGGQFAKYYLDKVEYTGVAFAYVDGAKVNVIVDADSQEGAQELYNWVDLMTRPESLPMKPPAALVEMVRQAILPKMDDDELRISLDNQQITTLRAALQPAIDAARQAAKQTHGRNDLRQFALGMHNFHDTFGKFPPAGVPDGKTPEKPLLSWRVYLLPYLEYGALYDQFHLDEPWDSEHNIKLVEKMPSIYIDPVHPLDDPTKTTYVVPAGEKASFQPGKTLGMHDMTDGTSNTILILNVAPEEAVIWTKPDEWDYDPENPFRGLTNLNPEGTFSAALVDGSVRQFSTKKLKPETMRNLIERNDGNVVNWDEAE